MAAVTEIGGGKSPIRAVQFVDPTGSRRTIRLGRVGPKAMATFKLRVEALLSASMLNEPLDRDLGFSRIERILQNRHELGVDGDDANVLAGMALGLRRRSGRRCTRSTSCRLGSATA